MSDVVIQVEDLSKFYRLGTIGTGSLRQDLQRFWTTKVRGKEDPFFTLGEGEDADHNSRYLWALKDINFEVRQGEVWGIVGHNGAGKSTLLKILSRIVRPTQGVVRGKGKISSLLEVGTGFHQELTGRENIYISGYILGMKKEEIRSKFDEIVAFSGIDNFIDTPVKRYSSGMYVRLAFAVAAHLEPDILIVDEVLAVGDAEFQKKCLGKMRDVSRTEGRTIIFVSHNVHAVNNLCNKAILLQRGRLQEMGDVQYVVHKYASSTRSNNLRQVWDKQQDAPGNNMVRIKHIELVPQLKGDNKLLDIRTPFTIRFEFWNNLDNADLITGLHLFTPSGDLIFDLVSNSTVCDKGIVAGECHIPGNFLNDGTYYFSLIIIKDVSDILFYHEECITFDVEDFREEHQPFWKWEGFVRPKFPFKIEQPSKIALAEKSR
jgi:lipopolysaccharide transport system ATP-binding protein